jgi:hypothetical protein
MPSPDFSTNICVLSFIPRHLQVHFISRNVAFCQRRFASWSGPGAPCCRCRPGSPRRPRWVGMDWRQLGVYRLQVSQQHSLNITGHLLSLILHARQPERPAILSVVSPTWRTVIPTSHCLGNSNPMSLPHFIRCWERPITVQVDQMLKAVRRSNAIQYARWIIFFH